MPSLAELEKGALMLGEVKLYPQVALPHTLPPQDIGCDPGHLPGSPVLSGPQEGLSTCSVLMTSSDPGGVLSASWLLPWLRSLGISWEHEALSEQWQET